MPPKKKAKRDESPTNWETFSVRYAGHPSLANDTLYALPEKLIRILAGREPGFLQDAEKGAVPPFLSADEEEFELDLARCSGSGFFHRSAFRLSILVGDCGPTGGTDPQAANQAGADSALKAMLTMEFESRGLSAQQIENYFAVDNTRTRLVEDRAAAYAGWLITEPAFRRERDHLRESWGARVQKLGGFPVATRSVADIFWGVQPKPRPSPDDPYYAFCRRWVLEGLLTWDLPLPMQPGFGIQARDFATLTQAGVDLFIPWYLLRDHQLKLHDLARHLETERNPDQLRGWLSPPTTKQGPGFGFSRLRTQLVLYCYRRLAIGGRYGERRQTERLDRGFAAFLGLDDQEGSAIKKIRLSLDQQLPA